MLQMFEELFLACLASLGMTAVSADKQFELFDR